MKAREKYDEVTSHLKHEQSVSKAQLNVNKLLQVCISSIFVRLHVLLCHCYYYDLFNLSSLMVDISLHHMINAPPSFCVIFETFSYIFFLLSLSP